MIAEQKQKRLDVVTLLNEIFYVEDQAYLRRIVAIDETWIRGFEPELKSYSNEWRTTGSLRPKNSASSIKGQENYDLCLPSTRNHHARLPCGRSSTGVYYRAFMQILRRKMYKNRP